MKMASVYDDHILKQKNRKIQMINREESRGAGMKMVQAGPGRTD